jgi:hypothetical protein
MVLEGKLDLVSHLEGGRFPRKLPDDISGFAVDFVHGIGVTSRDQIVAFIVLVNRVDVEVVPRIRAVVTSTCLSWVQWKKALCDVSAL